MARKRPPLSTQLNRKPTSAAESAPASTHVDTSASMQTDTSTRSRAKSRVGKKVVSGFFEPQVSDQLRILAIEQGSTAQALLGKALNLLFIEYDKDAIASED